MGSAAKQIAGLEISQDFIRLAVLSFNKEQFRREVILVLEEPLASTTIKRGAVANENELVGSLTKLLKNSGKYKIRQVILSVPPDQIIFKDGQFALPERVAKQFVRCVAQTGLNVVAMEFHPVSFVRSMIITEDAPVLVKQKTDDGTFAYVFKNRQLVLFKYFPLTEVAKSKIGLAMGQITKSFKAKGDPITEKLSLEDIDVLEKYQTPQSEGSEWAVALGAAIRAISDNDEDQAINLVPKETEKAPGLARSHQAIALVMMLAVLVIAAYTSKQILVHELESLYSVKDQVNYQQQTREANQTITGPVIVADEIPAEDKTKLTIKILNSTATTGLAAKLKTNLEAAEFQATTGNHSPTLNQTTIRVKSATKQSFPKSFLELTNIVKENYQISEDELLDTDQSDIIIIIGEK